MKEVIYIPFCRDGDLVVNHIQKEAAERHQLLKSPYVSVFAEAPFSCLFRIPIALKNRTYTLIVNVRTYSRIQCDDTNRVLANWGERKRPSVPKETIAGGDGERKSMLFLSAKKESLLCTHKNSIDRTKRKNTYPNETNSSQNPKPSFLPWSRS